MSAQDEFVGKRILDRAAKVDSKRLAGFVAKAFDGTPSEFSEEFLRELRSCWRDALARSRRLVLLVVLLIALFVLLKGASVAEIAFAGIKLAPDAVDVITIAIPAVVAFLFAEYWGLYAIADQHESIHDEIYRQLHPQVDPLDRALHPPETTMPGGYIFLTLGRGPAGEALMVATATVSWLVALLAPFAFLITAYVLLILDFGAGKPALWISLVFSLFCVARAVGFWKVVMAA